jgi:hypothetical protein
MMRARARRAAGIAALSAVAVVAVAVSRTDQSLYSDPALQMKTVQQFLAGESSRPNDWARPDYADLSRNAGEDLIVWAPGTPLAFLPFVRAGLTPAHAARAVAVLALVAGSAGWACWFARFDLPDTILFAFALVVPWMRFASNAMFLYTSEILVFAIVPWILAGALAVERAKRPALAGATALGLAAGALYIVKYSATFVTAGVLVWFAWRAWRALTKKGVVPLFQVMPIEKGVRPLFSDPLLARRIGQLIAVTAGAAVPIAVLSRLNQQHGGAANLILATLGYGWRWDYIVDAVALPALSAADLDSLLRFVLMHPVHGITHNAFWLSLAGLPGGVLLVVLAARAHETSAAAELARAVFGASVAAILLVWTTSAVVSIESRHLASAGFAMLPLALAEGRAWWRDTSAPVRTLLGATACAFVLVPFAYGIVSVFAKTWRYPAGYRPAPSGIYNPLLAQHDAASAAGALARDFDSSTDIWYLVDPLTALDLPGRAIVRHADFIDPALLGRDRFLTSRRMRVHVVLPPRFEESGKGEAIRASFPQATSWSRRAIPGAEYVSWTAVLEPGDAQ